MNSDPEIPNIVNNFDDLVNVAKKHIDGEETGFFFLKKQAEKIYNLCKEYRKDNSVDRLKNILSILGEDTDIKSKKMIEIVEEEIKSARQKSKKTASGVINNSASENEKIIVEAGVKAQNVPLSKIKFDDEASKIFDTDEERIQNIKESMKDTGFDPRYPVFVFKNNKGDYVLYDGHHRLAAAEAAGLTEIPAFVEPLPQDGNIIEKCILVQTSRRNMSNGEKLRVIQHFMDSEANRAKKNQGRRNDLATSETRVPEVTGDAALGQMIGMSRKTVTRIKKILRHPELLEKVKCGDLSIKKAAEMADKMDRKEKVKEKKSSSEKRKPEKLEDISIREFFMLLKDIVSNDGGKIIIDFNSCSPEIMEKINLVTNIIGVERLLI